MLHGNTTLLHGSNHADSLRNEHFQVHGNHSRSLALVFGALEVPMIIDPLTLALAGHLVIAVADKVPTLNIEPSCRGSAQVAVPRADGQMPTTAEIRETCLSKEREAREQLVRQWSDFAGDHRASCTRSTSAGGIPSYIELLTCLEIADQARKLPDEPLRGTTGVSSGGMDRR